MRILAYATLVVVGGCAPEPLPLLRPYEGEWTPVTDEPIAFRPEAGIQRLTIGGEPLAADGATNFANRGDVVVQSWDEDAILIEARGFAMATTADYARDATDLLDVIATRGPLGSPESIARGDDCLRDGWKDGCQIRVLQRGRDQQERAGADLRVTLPSWFRGQLDVVTSDVDDENYHNHGNVCVAGLAGSLNARVAHGQVWVTLAEDISPTPSCAPEDFAACEASGWETSCPCAGAFGSVVAESSRDLLSATIDVPAGLWGRVELLNASACRRGVDVDGFVVEDDGAGSLRGRFGGPADAVQGLGYGLIVRSERCAAVPSTSSPEAFDPIGEEATVGLGDAFVCEGCLRTATCEELLP